MLRYIEGIEAPRSYPPRRLLYLRIATFLLHPDIGRKKGFFVRRSLRPAGVSRGHNTRRLHTMAPGLVGQTIEQAAGRLRMRVGCAGAKVSPVICGRSYGLAPGRLDRLQHV
jgi:hypothetical protein